MLIPILLSIFWAICSTILIQPWFWIGLIKRKTIIGDEEHRGFSGTKDDTLQSSIILQIVFGCITLVLSLVIHLLVNVRYNFYGEIGPILLVLLFQFLTLYDGWIEHRTLKSFTIIGIAIICCFFSITDAITTYKFDIVDIKNTNKEVPIVVSTIKDKTEDKTKNRDIFDSSTIASLFDADEDDVSGPVYTNKKFVYTITDSLNGKGIVVIDEKNAETAKFISRKYYYGMTRELRNKYPFKRIKELKNIVVSDDNTPYYKFALLEKPNMFGAPVLEKYVLRNLQTGKFEEYEVEELPDFAK